MHLDLRLLRAFHELHNLAWLDRDVGSCFGLRVARRDGCFGRGGNGCVAVGVDDYFLGEVVGEAREV